MVEDTRIVSEANVAYVAEKFDVLKELKWIESTGEQYIDTGYNPNNNTKIEIVYWIDQSGCIFGVDNGWKETSFCIWADALGFGTDVSTYATSGGVAYWNYLYKIYATLSQNGFMKNGTLYKEFANQSFSLSNSLPLFCLKRNGDCIEYASMKLYSCKIYENDNLVRDYIPCIKNSYDVGLFDLVENKFYGNQGTGKFIAGPEAKIPIEYKELEYIETSSDGNTGPYINTGIKPTGSAKLFTDFQYTENNNSDGAYLYGVRASWSSTKFEFMFKPDSSTNHGYFRISYNNSTQNDSSGNLDTSRHQITLDKAELRYETSRAIVFSQTNFSLGYELGLFSCNTRGVFDYFGEIKLYSFEYYDDSVKRFFVPCKHLETGLCGLYELYEKKFYSNSGDPSLNNAILSGPENSTERYIVSSNPQKPAKMKFVSKIFGLESNGSLDNRIVNVGLLKHIIQKCGLTLPDGYVRLEYIRGTTGNDMNTGVYYNNTHSMEIEFEASAYTGGAFIGENPSNGDSYEFRVFNYTDGKLYYDFGSNRIISNSTILLNTKYKLKIGNYYAEDLNNNEVLASGTPLASYNPVGTLTLFFASSTSKYKIFSLKIFQNDVIIHNYVPCKKTSNNRVGLFDLVTQTMLYGTTDPIAGPEL